jgi:hypothetical protein
MPGSTPIPSLFSQFTLGCVPRIFARHVQEPRWRLKKAHTNGMSVLSDKQDSVMGIQSNHGYRTEMQQNVSVDLLITHLHTIPAY